MAWIQSYGCVTAAGDTAADFYAALCAGRVCVSEPNAPRAFYFKGGRADTVHELLLDKLLAAYQPVKSSLDLSTKFGVILASTKGVSADFVAQPGHAEDPLTPLLREFLRRSELSPARSLCVSNACSSALAAMALGERWMDQGLAQVLVISADAVTPFVQRGFTALKLIAEEGPRPFAHDRDGFLLGEGAACILLSAKRENLRLRLHHVGLDSEGSAVTRPSSSGESLRRAALQIAENSPEILIGHGTGTLINDETEDLAFADFFTVKPWITGSKWCIGHTLGVSGALDTIAACEALHHQQIFRLMTTEQVDGKFRGQYLTKFQSGPLGFQRIMISSLGFGGMHASAMIEQVNA